MAVASFPSGEETTLRDGRRVRLYRSGNGQSDTAIFFCHGAGGRSEQWRLLWPLLSGADARLIAWDMPGHGRSPIIRHASAYAGSAMADDFIELIERFGTRRNLVVAHSYGAKLTLAMLQKLHGQGREKLIARAVLLGSPSPQPTVVATLLRLPAWILGLFRRKLERGFRAAAWHESADPELVEYEERKSRRNSLRVFKALALQGPELDVPALARLDLPVLLLTGESDGLTPVRAAQSVEKALPRAKLHVVARCGHQVMLEQPEATAERLAAFFDLDPARLQQVGADS